jgi:hypothetical protein
MNNLKDERHAPLAWWWVKGAKMAMAMVLIVRKS